MIEIYNIRDSYKFYRDELLKIRIKEVQQFTEEQFKDNYTRYPLEKIKKLEQDNSVTPVIAPSMTTYINIVHGYLKFLMTKVFQGHDVRLGSKLGIIGVRGKKVKPVIDYKGEVRGVAPSWGKTRQLWASKAENLGLTLKDYISKTPQSERKLVYCFNEHSEYIKYRIVWYKKNVTVKNKTYYGLTFNRANRRQLWKLINEGKEYLVIE